MYKFSEHYWAMQGNTPRPERHPLMSGASPEPSAPESRPPSVPLPPPAASPWADDFGIERPPVPPGQSESVSPFSAITPNEDYGTIAEPPVPNDTASTRPATASSLSASSLIRRRTLAQFGWAIYGLGTRSVSAVIFMVSPLLIVASARKESRVAELHALSASRAYATSSLAQSTPPLLLPTTLPTLAISAALIMQCCAAPFVAAAADLYGVRRLLMSAHIGLGVLCIAGLVATPDSAPVLVHAALVALLYYAFAISWMMQNSLLPSVASPPKRPALSLVSAVLSNLGGGAFLMAQLWLLHDETVRHGVTSVLLGHGLSFFGSKGGAAEAASAPIGIDTTLALPAPPSRVELVAEDGGPSSETLRLICVLAAGSWLASALPALACLSALRTEPATDPAAHETGARPAIAAARPPVSLRVVAHAVRASIQRLWRARRYSHASRFVLSQALYLSAGTADAASAALFASEVVGLSMVGMILLTVYAAFAGAAGAATTGVLSRFVSSRRLLACLMCVPPLLLVYSACVLDSVTELYAVAMARAFISGGVGFQGLNRGVYAQMVPRGREAEFFGHFFVAVKLTSWVAPLATTLVMHVSGGSLRLGVLSALAFYVPSVFVMLSVDFDAAMCEAAALESEDAAGAEVAAASSSKESSARAEGEARRLVKGPALAAGGYGTAG